MPFKKVDVQTMIEKQCENPEFKKEYLALQKKLNKLKHLYKYAKSFRIRKKNKNRIRKLLS